MDWKVAVILGCIASATAPAATLDVVVESKTKGPFADLLLAIVAIDDAWALIVFSFGLAFVTTVAGVTNATSPLIHAFWDVAGSLLLGLLIGLPAAYLTGRVRKGRPMLTEALGLVFVCGGLAFMFDASFLIAAMIMGACIANLAKHHEYPFHEIENIEWPVMIVFFVLAGASLNIDSFKLLGLAGACYVAGRTVGKVLGVWVGGTVSAAHKDIRNWMGIALLPQAGVPIGMALVASNQLPQYREMILPMVFGTTVIFDLVGPLLQRLALRRVS